MKIETEAKTVENSDLDLSGNMVSYHQTNRLIGKVLTLIETLGLSEKQEQSIKDILKQTIRQGISEHDNFIITKEIFDIVGSFNSELHKQCIKEDSHVPRVLGASLRDGEYKLSFTSKY